MCGVKYTKVQSDCIYESRYSSLWLIISDAKVNLQKLYYFKTILKIEWYFKIVYKKL